CAAAGAQRGIVGFIGGGPDRAVSRVLGSPGGAVGGASGASIGIGGRAARRLRIGAAAHRTIATDTGKTGISASTARGRSAGRTVQERLAMLLSRIGAIVGARLRAAG